MRPRRQAMLQKAAVGCRAGCGRRGLLRPLGCGGPAAAAGPTSPEAAQAVAACASPAVLPRFCCRSFTAALIASSATGGARGRQPVSGFIQAHTNIYRGSGAGRENIRQQDALHAQGRVWGNALCTWSRVLAAGKDTPTTRHLAPLQPRRYSWDGHGSCAHALSLLATCALQPNPPNPWSPHLPAWSSAA